MPVLDVSSVGQEATIFAALGLSLFPKSFLFGFVHEVPGYVPRGKSIVKFTKEGHGNPGSDAKAHGHQR